MRRRRLLLVILLIIIIVGASFAAYVTSPSWLPRATTVSISPSRIATESGTRLAFTATVKYGSVEVAGGTIAWQTTGGSLDKSTGTTVVFTAPTVTSNESLTLTASFGGTGVYQPSSATAQVVVSPSKPKQTVLTVAPTMFELHSGDTLAIDASLSPPGAPVESVTWSLSPSGVGSLSSTTGASVTYTAPTVTTNTTVTVTASFAGNSTFLGSSASSTGSIFPSGTTMKKTTTMGMSPPKFVIQSNGTQALTASVEDTSGNTLSGIAITWSLSPSGVGSLSSTTGASVTYTAPTVTTNTTVTVTASFAGNSTFLGSSASSTGVVMPKVQTFSSSDLYVLTFDSAYMTNVKFTGPITMNGTSVTEVSADIANMTHFSLSHMNLSATEMDVTGVSWYVTYANLSSSVPGTGIVLTGGQSVNRGPISSANYGKSTMNVVQWTGSGAHASGLISYGQYIGGSEPYVPNLITTPSCAMSHEYVIEGPVTYGSFANESWSINIGEVGMQQFSFEHPIAYSLDRQTITYSSTNRWLLKSSSATALNVTAYIIYFESTALGAVTVTATGNELIRTVIPMGYNVGASLAVTNLSVHAIYFAATSMTLGNFVLSIE